MRGPTPRFGFRKKKPAIPENVRYYEAVAARFQAGVAAQVDSGHAADVQHLQPPLQKDLADNAANKVVDWVLGLFLHAPQCFPLRDDNP